MWQNDLFLATQALKELRQFWKGKKSEDVDKDTNYDNRRRERELMQKVDNHLLDYQMKRDLIE